MRIILIGQGPFGEKVLEALIKRGENVVGAFTPSGKRGEAVKGLAERLGIPLYCSPQMKDPQVYDAYVELQPDLAMLAFVTDIIPERLLNVPSIGTICYHPSLLPRHRGASAINWAIIQGDSRTGLTIYWVDEGIDTGPILLQKEVEISSEDTAGSLYFNILFPMGVKAMIEAVELIKKGEAPRIPQDDSKATYEPPCDDRVASIDFGKPINEIYNLIKGCDPQPGAYTIYKGKKVRLYNAKRFPSETEEKSAGEIFFIDENGIQIAAKDGMIQAGKLKWESGEKIGPMEFARLVDLKTGDRFGE